jgi:hypothetical protein
LQASRGTDSNAFVVGVLFDSGSLDRSAIEFDPVRFGDYVAHGAYELRDVVQLVTCPASKIDVDGWPGHGCPPSCEQKRTFEDKAIREWRLRQSIQESLHREVLEEFLERAALRTRLVEQSLPNRRSTSRPVTEQTPGMGASPFGHD